MTGYDPPGHDTTGPGWWEAGATKSFTHIKLTKWDFSDPLDSLDRSPRPDLAVEWEIQDEGKTYVFHLRKGVKWADLPPVNGREVTADDVVFSYNRYLSPTNPNRGVLGPVESVEALDDYTVVFRLSEPYAPFLTYTSDSMFPIEAPEVLEEFGGFETADSVIGAGPWNLVEYVEGERQVFERNSNYYRGPNGVTGEMLPYIDRVEVLFIFDDALKLAMYRTGKLDVGPGFYYWGYWSATPELVEALRQTNPELLTDLRIIVENPMAVHRVQPRVDLPPFNNQKLRQAVSAVLDRSYELWYNGASIEARELVSKHPWFLPRDQLGEGAKFYPVDEQGNPSKDFELAAQLVAEAKQEMGLPPDYRFEVPIWIHRLEPIFEDVATVWKTDLAKIGIDLDIRVLEFSEYQEKIFGKRDYEGIVFEWSREYSEPIGFFYDRFIPDSLDNLGRVNDPDLAAKVLELRRTLDPARQEEIVHELQRYLAVKQYEWEVPNWLTYNLYAPWLKNVGPHKRAEMGNSFLEAWFTPDAPARQPRD